MRYLPKSPADREAMLAEIGVASIENLFPVQIGPPEMTAEACDVKFICILTIIHRFRVLSRPPDGKSGGLFRIAHRHLLEVEARLGLAILRGRDLPLSARREAQIVQQVLASKPRLLWSENRNMLAYEGAVKGLGGYSYPTYSRSRDG